MREFDDGDADGAVPAPKTGHAQPALPPVFASPWCANHLGCWWGQLPIRHPPICRSRSHPGRASRSTTKNIEQDGMIDTPPGVPQGTGDGSAKLQWRKILGRQQAKLTPARVETLATPRRVGRDGRPKEVPQRTDQLGTRALPAPTQGGGQVRLLQKDEKPRDANPASLGGGYFREWCAGLRCRR